MRILAILLLAAAALPAQTPSSQTQSAQTANVEIVGTVTEVGGGPVADATVTLAGVDQVNRTAKTDGSGTVRFMVNRQGPYTLISFKEGYLPMVPSATSTNFVMVTGTSPTMTARMQMERPVQIGGQVLDDETRESVAGVEVFLVQRRWELGQPLVYPISRGASKTDADGRFLFAGNLRAGDYLVSTRAPFSPYSVRILPAFTDADRETTDTGYELSFWPGGRDAASALPLQVGSGGFGNAGTILVHKTPQYRLHATFSGKCFEDDRVSISVLKRDGGRALDSMAQVGCDEELLLSGLDPGSYGLYAISAHQQREDVENAFAGFAPFEITDRNAELSIDLKPVTVLEATVKFPEGLPEPPPRLMIQMRPLDLLPGALPPVEDIHYWTSATTFRLGVTQPIMQMTLRSSQANRAAIREVRYNGLPISDGVLRVGSTNGKLEVAMDGQGGSVTGRLLEDGAPRAPTSILFLPEDVPPSGLEFQWLVRSTVQAGGTYRVPYADPGAYRAIAFRTADTDLLHQPGNLERAAAAAPRVEVGPGETKTVDLRLTSFR